MRWVFWNLVLVLPPKLSMKLSHLHAPPFPPLCIKHIQSSQGSHTPSTSMACPPDTFSLYLPCVPAPKPCQITSRLSLPCIPQKSLYTAYLCPAVLKRPLTFYKWLADTLLLTKTKHESRPLEALGRVGGAVSSWAWSQSGCTWDIIHSSEGLTALRWLSSLVKIAATKKSYLDLVSEV